MVRILPAPVIQPLFELQKPLGNPRAATGVPEDVRQTLLQLARTVEAPMQACGLRAKNAGGGGAWVHGAGTPGTNQSSNANLSALTASTSTSSGGPFTTLDIGSFAAGTTAYTASVAYERTYVKLTPTVAAGTATVGVRKGPSGGFTTVASGTASAAISLDVGANALTVRVTAADRTTTKDYTVTVSRGMQAPAMVTLSASPTLVEEGRSVTLTATLSRALARTVTGRGRHRQPQVGSGRS